MDLTTIEKVSKAIAGAVAGALVMFFAKNNFIIADELNDAIEIIIGAIITAGLVYIAPKNRETK